jgi:acyl-coenzyme A thioesterase PaaI-like protein
MQHKVVRKQYNSGMCLVCGLDNPSGLHAHFYELDNKELLAIFHTRDDHQGYPGRMHGGMLTAIIDETIGRAIGMHYDDMVWGVTLEFNVKFKKPVPTETEIRVVARITGDEGRIFTGTGEILLPDGRVAVEGWGKYMKLPLEKIAEVDTDHLKWAVVPLPNDPEVVDI